MPHLKQSIQTCIDACTTCHHVCLETATHCLEKGGPHAAPAHMLTMADCVAICAASAEFMLRGSAHQVRLCALCAEICDMCARSCEAIDDDAEMRRCAEACRRCADACRQMAA